MVEVIKELLNLLNNDKGASYLVGGAVIAYLMGFETHDLDFATTLSDSDLKAIFSDINTSDFGGYKLEYMGYHVDITHMRNDINIVNGYPKTYELTDSIILDANRRDFKINALYLNKDLEIKDYVDGLTDFNNKIIDVIGDINIVLNDPIRILRAIRFMITYHFNLSDNLEAFIKNNANIIDYQNYHIKNEINKIINLGDYQVYSSYIKDLGLDLSFNW